MNVCYWKSGHGYSWLQVLTQWEHTRFLEGQKVYMGVLPLKRGQDCL